MFRYVLHDKNINIANFCTPDIHSFVMQKERFDKKKKNNPLNQV